MQCEILIAGSIQIIVQKNQIVENRKDPRDGKIQRTLKYSQEEVQFVQLSYKHASHQAVEVGNNNEYTQEKLKQNKEADGGDWTFVTAENTIFWLTSFSPKYTSWATFLAAISTILNGYLQKQKLCWHWGETCDE